MYYGLFKNNVKKYKILSGHKKKILFISEFYKNQFLNEKLLLQMQKKNTSNKRQSISVVEKPSENPSGSKRHCLEVVNTNLQMKKQ